MWIMTTLGFFSIVQKKGDEDLTIRARAKGDLETFKTKYLPSMGEVLVDAGSDYKYRAKASRTAVAGALAAVALDVDYSNFKNTVCERQSPEREKIYEGVWTKLLELGSLPAPKVAKKGTQAGAHKTPGGKAKDTTSLAHADGRWQSYGGILFDKKGRVLVRRPEGAYGKTDWSFAKGQGKPGETPEAAALREVKEEAGVEAEIIAPIPGNWKGGHSYTCYWLMHPVSKSKFGGETDAVRWVSPDKAKALLGSSRDAAARERDLAVLAAALEMLDPKRQAFLGGDECKAFLEEHGVVLAGKWESTEFVFEAGSKHWSKAGETRIVWAYGMEGDKPVYIVEKGDGAPARKTASKANVEYTPWFER